MTTRKPTSSGPQYGMVAFAGSRQPPGPSPRAIELLHEAKIQVAADRTLVESWTFRLVGALPPSRCPNRHPRLQPQQRQE